MPEFVTALIARTTRLAYQQVYISPLFSTCSFELLMKADNANCKIEKGFE